MVMPDRQEQLQHRVAERLSAARERFLAMSLPRYTDGQRRTIASWMRDDPRMMDEAMSQYGPDKVQAFLEGTLGG